MNLVRLNAAQHAVVEHAELDGRPFVQVDIHMQEPGIDSFVRMLISPSKAAELAEALLAARDDVEPARLERS